MAAYRNVLSREAWKLRPAEKALFDLFKCPLQVLHAKY